MYFVKFFYLFGVLLQNQPINAMNNNQVVKTNTSSANNKFFAKRKARKTSRFARSDSAVNVGSFFRVSLWSSPKL